MHIKIWRQMALFFCLFFLASSLFAANGMVVFQSDFGLKDGAVSAAKGVMYSVDKSLVVSDLTNEIPVFNIWDASYRLFQTMPYWPTGTVFVSVVDPGVGTSRRSVVAETKTGHYIVTPDNGTLTLVDDALGIKTVRIIDETKHRLKGSDASHTFYGRDVYAYAAAKLAAGKISFEEVGPISKDAIVKLPYQKPTMTDKMLRGTVVILDPQYGNVWTNLDKDLLEKFDLEVGKRYRVKIYENNLLRYSAVVPFYRTFGHVKKGEDMLYVNSLLNLAVATNQKNFAETHRVSSGAKWMITVEKI